MRAISSRVWASAAASPDTAMLARVAPAGGCRGWPWSMAGGGGRCNGAIAELDGGAAIAIGGGGGGGRGGAVGGKGGGGRQGGDAPTGGAPGPPRRGGGGPAPSGV